MIVTAAAEGATGIGWVETRDVAKHTTMHTVASSTESDPDPNVTNAEAENPWFSHFLMVGRDAPKATHTKEER